MPMWFRWFYLISMVFLGLLIIPNLAGLFFELFYREITFEILFNDPVQYLFSWDRYRKFLELNPVNMLGWLIIGFIFVSGIIFVFSGRFKRKDIFEERPEYGSHGSARWQTKKEVIDHYYKSGKKGFILGDIEKRIYVPNKKYAIHPVEGKLNNQMIVFGTAGTEKTTGIILPNIINCAENLGFSQVITDPKGEIYEYTSSYLEKKGYEVLVLDFLNLERGNRINFLDYIEKDNDLISIAESFITGGNVARGSKGSLDPIWDEGEKALLAALMGFVKQVYKDEPHKQTLATVAKILNTEFAGDFNYLFKRNGVTGTPEFLFNNFLLAKDKVRDGILFGLATKLTLFAFPAVQNITSKSDIRLSDLGRRKIALFVMVSDAERTYSPLVTVFWSILFNQLYRLRLIDKNANVPVLALMDELANIGRIGGFQEKLSTMRGRKIYPIMIWQSLSQLKDRYPGDAWQDVISNCDTQLLLGANDDDTKKYFSELLGTTTVEVQSFSQNKKREQIDITGASTSLSYQGRKLMFPDEIGRMQGDQLIVVQRGRFPTRLRKVQYQYWNPEYQICEPRSYMSIPEIPGVADEDEYVEIPQNILTTISEKDRLEAEKIIVEERKSQGVAYNPFKVVIE